MKTVIYKLLEIDNNAVESEFDRTEILNEKELRERFYWYLQHDYFDKENLENYSVSPDISETDVMEELDISTIVNIFAENCDYDLDSWFLIDQIEIELTDNDLYN